ncbi:MAG: hypothetical protein QM808_11170 [Steroidobacteraceae bacterium]
MTRIKAALTHLLISALLAGIVICLIVFGWYPTPFFWALGGPMLLALIVGIDVVLGPLMTMILFNPKKSRRELTLDLTLIGIIQLSALGYGLYSGYVGRMVYGVFSEKAFHLVEASEIAPDFLKQAPYPEFQTLPFAGYLIIGTQIPDTDKARDDLAFFKQLGVGPQHLPQFHAPLAMNRQQIVEAAIPQTTLQQKHSALAEEIQQQLERHQLRWNDVAILPFETPAATYTAILNLQNMTMVKVLRATPR